ncbi:hypothetical protein T439DRAFT_380411 [Meredithblackwellia eburnea MCA 4105]
MTLIIALTTLSTALDISDIWHFGTLQLRTVETLLQGTLVETIEPVIVGCVAVCTQGILVVRAAKMFEKNSHKLLLGVFSGLTITTSFLGAVGAAVWGFLYYRNPFLDSNFTPTYNQCLAIWLGWGAASDLMITAAFICTLRKRTRLSDFNPTTASAYRLIISLTLQSAAYTTLIAVPGAILSLVFNGNTLLTTDIQYPFWIPLPGLYALSLFTTLSVPDQVQSRLRGVSSNSAHPSTTLWNERRRSSAPPTPFKLQRQRTTSTAARASREDGRTRSRAADGVSVQVEFHISEEKDSPDNAACEWTDLEADLIGSPRSPDPHIGTMPGAEPDIMHLCPQ